MSNTTAPINQLNSDSEIDDETQYWVRVGNKFNINGFLFERINNTNNKDGSTNWRCVHFRKNNCFAKGKIAANNKILRLQNAHQEKLHIHEEDKNKCTGSQAKNYTGSQIEQLFDCWLHYNEANIAS